MFSERLEPSTSEHERETEKGRRRQAMTRRGVQHRLSSVNGTLDVSGVPAEVVALTPTTVETREAGELVDRASEG